MIPGDTPLFTGEMTIGQIVTQYPATRAVIQKYFHGGCHHCPSQHVEPLWLAARMYGLALERLLIEMHEAIRQPDLDQCDTVAAAAVVLSPTERRLLRDRARGLQY